MASLFNVLHGMALMKWHRYFQRDRWRVMYSKTWNLPTFCEL